MLLFASVFVSAVLLKINWLLVGVPGGDLVGSDIPKSLMLLKGQNPYATNPWEAPYPPFLLLLDAAIIQLTGGSIANVAAVAWNIRTVGLIAELSIGTLIFLGLRARNAPFLGMLSSTIVWLLDPSISSSNYFYFHSDIFGILILSASLYMFVKERVWTGMVLLAVASIFKVHPILSVPLVLVWLVRRKGLIKSIPVLLTASTIVVAGLVVPFWIPGYAGTFLGFNMTNGADAHGMNSFSLFNLFYGILPTYWNISFSTTIVNDVWIACTAGLFVAVLGIVWSRSKNTGPVEVVLLGLVVWLLPLRQLQPAYLLWMIVPLLMLGRTRLTLVTIGLFESASLMVHWSWNLGANPFPWMISPLGFFISGLVLASCSVISLFWVLNNPSPSRVPTGLS